MYGLKITGGKREMTRLRKKIDINTLCLGTIDSGLRPYLSMF